MLSVFSERGRSAHFGVKRLANILGTAVGYLLGKTEQSSILLTLDHFIKSAKISLL